MAKKILDSINVSKLDIINAESSQSFKKAVGEAPISIKGAALIEEPDRETGEEKKYAYIFTPDAVYGGNSATIYRAVSNLLELMAETPDKEYAFTVASTPTANGRDFLTLNIREV